jgi:hypothetical protein
MLQERQILGGLFPKLYMHLIPEEGMKIDTGWINFSKFSL